MTPALAWWTAGLVPVVLVAAFAGLMTAVGRAWWRDIDARRAAEYRARRAEALAHDRLVRMHALSDALTRERIARAAESDGHALARHQTAAANQGLFPPERLN